MKKIFLLIVLMGSYASHGKTKTFDGFSQAPMDASSSGPGFFKRIGFGIASYEYLTASARPVLSLVWPSMDEGHLIQAIFGMDETSPLEFRVGANYRYNWLGTMTAGFHLGGGLIIGKRQSGIDSTDTIGVLHGLIGPHFTIPSLSRILFMFDAGPMMLFQPGTNDFAITAAGPLLGFSVHYIF